MFSARLDGHLESRSQDSRTKCRDLLDLPTSYAADRPRVSISFRREMKSRRIFVWRVRLRGMTWRILSRAEIVSSAIVRELYVRQPFTSSTQGQPRGNAGDINLCSKPRGLVDYCPFDGFSWEEATASLAGVIWYSRYSMVKNAVPKTRTLVSLSFDSGSQKSPIF